MNEKDEVTFICPVCDEENEDGSTCDWCGRFICDDCMGSGFCGENMCVECKEHRR